MSSERAAVTMSGEAEAHYREQVLAAALMKKDARHLIVGMQVRIARLNSEMKELQRELEVLRTMVE